MAETDLKETIDHLRAARDELRLQMHLAKADARDEWEKLEQRWERLEGELDMIKEHSKAPMREIGDATRQVIDEIKRGYGRIRDQLR